MVCCYRKIIKNRVVKLSSVTVTMLPDQEFITVVTANYCTLMRVGELKLH